MGMLLMFSGFAFGVIETIYFGCNWLPMSKEEFICDKISEVSVSVGLFLFALGVIRQIINDINSLK